MRRITSKGKRFYGWIALSGACLVYFSGCGNIYYSFGVFLPSICNDLGWTRATVAGAYSLMLLLLGLVGPIAGFSVTRFGPRKSIILGNTLAALGLVALRQTTEVWHLYLFYGIMAGVGVSLGMLIPSSTVATNWFERKRPLALSLVIVSGGIGGLVLPPLISVLNSELGWQTGWLILGCTHLVLAVFIPGLIIRDKPEEVGQLPDGSLGEDSQGTPAPSDISDAYRRARDWTTRAAVRTPAFWLIGLLIATHFFSVNIVLTHQVAYVEDSGFSHIIAATALGLIPGVSILGRLVFGPLAIRFDVRHLTAVSLAGMMIALVILVTAKALFLVYLYAVVFGVCHGAVMVARFDLTSSFFGRANFAQILGWQQVIAFGVGAAAAPLAGAIHDVWGSYTPAFIVMIVFLAVGIASAIICKPPMPDKVAPAPNSDFKRD
jgi:MFS family permease